ncbi:ABC transporter ATP-binding protein [Rickettsiaceae bacterium]|nr:ABC transporter ATP-binding protein [Rickettsiaceae bacterium]
MKSFGDGHSKIDVLKSVDMHVQSGEFLMLVGPSGCGKTTLISIITGILPYDSGSCHVDNNDYKKMSQRDLLQFRAKNIGFIFQSYNLIPTLTVAENAALPLIIGGMNRHEAIEQSISMLSSLGLEAQVHFSPNTLSGGEQQRVAIARSLVHSPKILICDEPTSALDFATGTKIVEIMRDVNKKLGTTFVVVTHDNRILKYADRIIHLDDGIIEKETKGNHHESL